MTDNKFDVSSLGLSSEEAERLTLEGKCNKTKTRAGKSYPKIIFDNIFTFFNMIWLAVALVLIAVGSYSNLTFLAIVIPNALIALFQ